MIIDTSACKPVESKVIDKYFESLVNRFFKILPMRENGEASLETYMRSLQCELLGCKNLISLFKESDSYISLLSILQYLVDTPECPVADVKREVFKAISICNRIRQSLDDKEADAR